MSAGRRNKKVIFIIYILVALIGYFTVPMLLKSLPVEKEIELSRFNVVGISNEVEVISDHEIMSYKNSAGVELDEYLICSIDDDPDGINAHGIYDPTDLAVTVSSLVRLDIKHLFLGTHAHWPDLPSFENNTLRSQLESLDSCILSTPLRRSAVASELPSYLLDSSLAKDAVQEGVELLPVVNNLSLALTFDIPENCKVGFSQLESEAESANIPLLAVWDDRVILSSLLLERMHQLGVGLDGLKIVLGTHIKLGSTGNLIPINEFGYFIPGEKLVTAEADIISAEITSVKESPVDTQLAILTASGEKADSYRAIENPLEQLSQLARTPFVEEQVMYQRVSWWSELLVVLLIGVLLCLLARLSIIAFWIWALVLGAGAYFGSASLHGNTNYFMPILYILIALFVCVLVRLFFKKGEELKKEKTPKSQEIDEETTEIEVPKRLMTLSEKMRKEGEEVKSKNEMPKEIRMLIEQLEGKKEPKIDFDNDFNGDFCDLSDLSESADPKRQVVKKKSDSKSN